MSQKSTPLLTYYFNNQKTFYYNPPSKLFAGDVIPISMSNNDSSKSVISFTNKGITSYYTLNSLFISLNTNDKIGSMYQLILQGNKNDYANNSTNQILFIIPIFKTLPETIEGKSTSITALNKLYISSILDNIVIGETYNFTYKNTARTVDSDTIDMNQFLVGINEGKLYTNIIDSNTNYIYNIIEFESSNLFYNISSSVPELSNLLKTISIGTTESIPINILNNNGPISTITETDIYIDCSPTNNIGEAVDIYTSKNLDQLNLFQIDDLKIWAFRFITIFVILLIIFVTIKIFNISEKTTLNTTSTPSSAIAAAAISSGVK
jgi:hypothetical protein